MYDGEVTEKKASVQEDWKQIRLTCQWVLQNLESMKSRPDVIPICSTVRPPAKSNNNVPDKTTKKV